MELFLERQRSRGEPVFNIQWFLNRGRHDSATCVPSLVHQSCNIYAKILWGGGYSCLLNYF